MQKVNLKYTGAKTSEELGSAMVPESTLRVLGTLKVRRLAPKEPRKRIPEIIPGN